MSDEKLKMEAKVLADSKLIVFIYVLHVRLACSDIDDIIYYLFLS
jgi:hypothetical protein